MNITCDILLPYPLFLTLYLRGRSFRMETRTVRTRAKKIASMRSRPSLMVIIVPPPSLPKKSLSRACTLVIYLSPPRCLTLPRGNPSRERSCEMPLLHVLRILLLPRRPPPCLSSPRPGLPCIKPIARRIVQHARLQEAAEEEGSEGPGRVNWMTRWPPWTAVWEC